jgi:hypothetical protein
VLTCINPKTVVNSDRKEEAKKSKNVGFDESKNREYLYKRKETYIEKKDF